MRYWILGMGGVATGSLAIALGRMGDEVGGSDSGVYPPMSDLLREAGICWQEGFSANGLAAFAEAGECTVVVGNAIPRGNPELEYALDSGLRLTSLPEVLHERFLQDRVPVVCAGTHGKTTTSNLSAWVLQQAGLSCGWFVGGKTAGLNTPLSAAVEGAPFVIEGDEYDTVFYDKRSKFFHYWPQVLVLNHLEFDHADIFSSLEEIRTAFRRLVNMVPAKGLVLVNGDCGDALAVCEKAFCPVIQFGSGTNNTYQLLDEKPGDTYAVHRCLIPTNPTEPEAGREELCITSKLQGEYNGRNLLAALAVADRFGVSRENFLKAVRDFAGPARRMDRYELRDGFLLYDDFAHHPTAITGVIQSLRRRYPDRKILLFFEPRSNTSVTRVMQKEWEQALAGADRVWMGPLHRRERYAADVLFDLESAALYLASHNVPFEQHQDLATLLDSARMDLSARKGTETLLLICSNGSFYGLREKLCAELG